MAEVRFTNGELTVWWPNQNTPVTKLKGYWGADPTFHWTRQSDFCLTSKDNHFPLTPTSVLLRVLSVPPRIRHPARLPVSFRFTIALFLSIVCLITPACATDTAETPDMNVVIANELNRSAEEGNATANDLQKLAEAGNAAARYRLGLLYHDGQGVPQSYEKANHWFTKAAEQGHAGAQVNLGTIYLVGHGFHQSDQLALFWFRKAAEQKDALACAKLGLMYARGQGVARNFIQAYMWSTLAVANGAWNTAEARNALAKQMTSAQIAEAQKLAQEWKPNSK